MDNEQKTEKKITPPYISVARLEALIDLISNRNYSLFSSDIFKKQGFSAADSIWSVSALKFLGVLNEDGTPTQLMAKFRLQGDARKTEIEKIVKNAYKLLFSATKEPQNLPSDELANEFVVQYDMSRGLAESAARVFIKLSEYGGLKEVGTVVAKIHKKPRAEKKKLPNQEKKAIKSSAVYLETATPNIHVHPIIKGKMSITIPEKSFSRLDTDDTMNDTWRTIVKAAHKFAEEYLKDETSESEKPEAS